MQVYSLSTKGSRNQQNEDAYLCSPKAGLFLVADGMGGHAGSAYASQYLVRCFLRLQQNGLMPSQSLIVETIQEANHFIHNRAQTEKGIGSTLSLLWFQQEKAQIFHVGDSRIYRFRDFKLEQLTTDHIAQKKELGFFQEAHTSSRGITRAIGIKPSVKIDQYQVDHESDDVYLIMSDGISDPIPDYQLLNVLSESENPNASTIQALIALASSQGGTDDKTLILISLK